MDENYRKALQNLNSYLVKNLELSTDFLVKFRDTGIIQSSWIAIIMVQTAASKEERNSKFLECITKTDNNAWEILMQSLTDTDQDEIALKLRHSLIEVEEENEKEES
ncbi:DgyrCDS3927 [Dimorphilus gyrociliatus]|uniref:DgyrCDS3927 n=1 Tax=Dimorphilus gyrociliatus TaxID=2664684 RepID=A0A7I8VGR3_9ANNE|nr:DgyrCDS3927 [Dimorphilus gyrociliatus]